MRNSVILENTIGSWEDQGPPICFNNREIRKMLELAKVGRDDVLYDLGSGWGQNLIIALTEFDVKKAIGVEDDRERYQISVNRLRKWHIPQERWVVIPGRFEKVLAQKVPQANPLEATVIFYGLSTDRFTLNNISRNLRTGGRLIYYYGCLFPEILPNLEDYPFFVSVAPFRRPSSELEWLMTVVKKKQSSLKPGRNTDPLELWSELRHDYDVGHYGNPVLQYRRRLRDSVASKERVFRAKAK
jgi:precorrin-6B methylase 2